VTYSSYSSKKNNSINMVIHIFN